MAADLTAQIWVSLTPPPVIKDNTNFNTSGLAVGPSGYRSTNGNYYGRSGVAGLWASPGSGAGAWSRSLGYTVTQVGRYNFR